ncbi:MAG: type IV secretion system DNA-binding domain-containing protein [Tepidisphaeraceae bacterium]
MRTDDPNDDVVWLGHRSTWGGQEPFGISAEERRRHVYVIGKTGAGKSTLLRNMLVQDIEAGRGVGLIDPHGDLAEELLDSIPPSRTRDVVYFNPCDRERPIGLNLLASVPVEARPLVASGIVAACSGIWQESWGPRTAYLVYASVAALLDAEASTLLGVPRLLADERYRAWVVRQVKDPIVRSFWANEFAHYSPALRAEVISPVQNKIGQLLMSPIIRNVLGQVRSQIDLRFTMDRGRVFVANLSKGRLGQDKSDLLGALLVAEFQLAAMSRTDTRPEDRRDFHLYVDEFQSFGTSAFASILSEARKYGLSLTLAHQFIGQIDPAVRDAIFGNVGTLIAFRVGEADAALLSREFGDGHPPHAFTELDHHAVRVKLASGHTHRDPFHGVTMPPLVRTHGRRDAIIRSSRERFSAPQLLIEDRISRWMRRRW